MPEAKCLCIAHWLLLLLPLLLPEVGVAIVAAKGPFHCQRRLNRDGRTAKKRIEFVYPVSLFFGQEPQSRRIAMETKNMGSTLRMGEFNSLLL